MESKLASASLLINSRIDTLESSCKTISVNTYATTSELSKIHSLFAEFGNDVRASTKSLQTKFEKELSDLSDKMKSLREADRMSKDYKNDGPSFTTVCISSMLIKFN